MKVVIRILAACCVLFSATAQAALTVYMDRATFNASNPGLVIEDFEEGIPKIGFPSPLNSTSDNGAFDPGDILDGVEFVSTELNPDALTIADGNDLTGLATKTLVKNASTSDELSFLQIKFSGIMFMRLVLIFISPLVLVVGWLQTTRKSGFLVPVEGC